MKKLAILSPLVILMASTSLAQDSCIVRPSCADMGYTKTEADCTGKTTLKCPFDLSAVSCSASEAAAECDWGYKLTSNNSCEKIENAIAFVVETTVNGGSITLATGSTNDFTVDWGDGTVENYTNTSAPTHSYAAVGQYPIIITGTVPSFNVSTLTNCNTIKILNADLDSVTSYAAPQGLSTFGPCSKVTGEIPNKLSPNLKTATRMFYDCSGLYGDIPELPSTITAAAYMFRNCSKLTGEIKSLPSGISNGSYMFHNCSNLTGAIPELPNSLTIGDNMFYGCSNLSQVAFTKFPNGLKDGYQMFTNCNKLAGSLPSLANTVLEDGRGMFANNYNLTGSIPELPSTLTYAAYVGNTSNASLLKEEAMFCNCSRLTGTAPKLSHTKISDGSYMFYNTGISAITDFPTGLTSGDYMFYGTQLTGEIPTLPSTLTSAAYMFALIRPYNKTFSIGDLPSGLTYTLSMFDYSYLSSVGNLPTGNIYSQSMFEDCTKLTSLPSNFANLTDWDSMINLFKGCTSLSGELPPFSNYTALKYYADTFAGTQVTNNTSSPWPDDAW